MKNAILISNWHITHTRAMIRDFLTIGFDVYLAQDNFGGRIKYFFSNDALQGLEPLSNLVGYEDFLNLQDVNKWILCGCTEQMDDFIQLSVEFGAELVYTVSKNDAEYPHGSADYLLSPDIQTFERYPASNKMLYFYPPVVTTEHIKDQFASYVAGPVCTYIHNYERFWPESWRYAQEFELLYSNNVFFYGSECPDGELEHSKVHERMAESSFTLYFKERESYGSMVLESMSLGTPVIALRRFIQDKTIGKFFLNEYNSIIVDSAADAIIKLKNLSFESYKKMSNSAIETVRRLTDNDKRLNQMRKIFYDSN